jgi:P-type conjugative transfer protein TrbJ
MRKHLIAASLLVISVQNPQPVEAGAFAMELTQVLNHGQLVMSYIRQGEQLANEINMYQNMLRNVKQLPGQTYGPIASDINSLATIVQGGRVLAYSLSNLDGLFRSTYPGYATNPTTYYRQYQAWSQTSLDTTLGALRAAGLQGQQLQNEQTVLNSLRGMAQTSDGQMQALQVIGEINEQQIQQLMKLRELMLADLTSKQAYQATVIQQHAADEAAAEWFFSGGSITGDGKTYLPGLR